MVDVATETGAERASVARVIARVGLSRRTFYELFDSRQACLVAVFDDGVERAAIRIRAAYGSEGAWLDRLRQATLALLSLLDEQPDLARLCVLRLHADEPAMRARRRHLLETVAGALDQGRGDLPESRQPSPLAGQAVAGAGLSLLYTALTECQQSLCDELLGPLMATLLLPYRSPGTARRELARRTPKRPPSPPRSDEVELFPLPRMRVTYRTARVLGVVLANPGVSNRAIANAAGIRDQGQISKLLARLRGLGLLENAVAESGVNAWQLTSEGRAFCRAIGIGRAAHDALG